MTVNMKAVSPAKTTKNYNPANSKSPLVTPAQQVGGGGTPSPKEYQYGEDVIVNGQNVGQAKFDTKTGKALTPKPVTILTSGLSKKVYADNVNSLNQANASIKQVQAGETAAGIAQSLGMSPENFLKINPEFAAKGNKGDFAGLSGSIQPGQTYKISPDGTPTEVQSNAPKPTETTVGDDGTTTNIYGDGTFSLSDTTGNSYSFPSGMDPMLAKMQVDLISQFTQDADDAKATIEEAKKTLANDPAAQVAAANISRQYDVLIKQMEEKNRMMSGSIVRNSARTGMLQYANEMDTSYKSMEFDKSIGRIADLVFKQNEAIAKSNAAFEAGNVKELDAAQKEYKTAVTEKQKTIMDLSKAINDQVKTNAAEIKQMKIDERNAKLDSLRISTGIARSVATQIAGIKDEAQIDSIIEDMAVELGITNSEILKSAVLKEQATISKESLATKNAQATLNKKLSGGTGGGGSSSKGGGKDGGYTYTGDDINTYTTFLNKGGTDASGNEFAGRGKDTYVDPGAYIAIYQDWISNNGTPQGFLKKFPKTNVHPDGRELLPEGLQ